MLRPRKLVATCFCHHSRKVRTHLPIAKSTRTPHAKSFLQSEISSRRADLLLLKSTGLNRRHSKQEAHRSDLLRAVHGCLIRLVWIRPQFVRGPLLRVRLSTDDGLLYAIDDASRTRCCELSLVKIFDRFVLYVTERFSGEAAEARLRIVIIVRPCIVCQR